MGRNGTYLFLGRPTYISSSNCPDAYWPWKVVCSLPTYFFHLLHYLILSLKLYMFGSLSNLDLNRKNGCYWQNLRYQIRWKGHYVLRNTKNEYENWTNQNRCIVVYIFLYQSSADWYVCKLVPLLNNPVHYICYYRRTRLTNAHFPLHYYEYGASGAF